MSYPILAPQNTWYKSSELRSTITEINIVDSYTPESYDEMWNADVDDTGAITCYRTGTVITMAGNGSGKIAMNEDSTRIFSHKVSGVSDGNLPFVNVTSIIGLDLLDESNVTILAGAFAYCLSLTTIDVGSWDTSKVTNMTWCFGANSAIGYMALTTLDVSNWDVSNVTSMKHMFSSCSNIKELDVSNWDTSSCTDMSYMFDKCTSLIALDVSNWDVSKVTSMEAMFQQENYGANYAPIKVLDVSKWDTSSCTDMSYMFYGFRGVSELDVSNFNTSKVTTFNHMFAHSYLCPDTTKWDTSSCTVFNAMFNHSGFTVVDVSNFNTSKAEYFNQMFESSTNLEKIIGLENFDTSSCKTFVKMFGNCPKLKTLNLYSFNTTNAKGTTKWQGFNNMFYNLQSLEEIIFGENFYFDGDGTVEEEYQVMLPTPDATYIDGADGMWYDIDGNAYAPADIPSRTARTYYASSQIANEARTNYLVKHRSIAKLADAVRLATDGAEDMTISKMEDACYMTGANLATLKETIQTKTSKDYDTLSAAVRDVLVPYGHSKTAVVKLVKADGTEVEYTSVYAALNAAVNGDTVQMVGDSVESVVTVPVGVTLDLNGCVLTADVFSSFGNVVDGENGGNGLLYCDKVSMPENEFLPIYDSSNGGYRLYKYTFVYLGVRESNDAYMLGATIRFQNIEGYKLIGESENAQINLSFYVRKVEKMTNGSIFDYTQENFKDWGATSYTKYSDPDYTGTSAMSCTITGISNIDNYKPICELTTETGMKVIAE